MQQVLLHRQHTRPAVPHVHGAETDTPPQPGGVDVSTNAGTIDGSDYLAQIVYSPPWAAAPRPRGSTAADGTEWPGLATREDAGFHSWAFGCDARTCTNDGSCCNPY